MLGKLRLIALGATVIVNLVAPAAPARADGIVIPRPPCPAPLPTAKPVPPEDCFAPFLPIEFHRVEVDIRDQVAEVRVDQSFRNAGDRPLEATYVFPLPYDAAVSDFTMLVDGRPLEGRLLGREEARRIYEETARRRRDPALLEYIDRGVFRASIFPIPARARRRVQISYTQVLQRDGGLVRFYYPLSTEKFSSRPIPEVTITVDIESKAPLRSVYSPTHDVAVSRDGEHGATVSLELLDVTPRSDFELLYSTSGDDIDLSLLTYATRGEAGYFLLLLSPQLEVAPGEVQPQDVVLVLDTSGSMRGEKLRQAKEAASYIVEHLNAEDRFAVVAFDSTIRVSHEGLAPASEGRVEGLEFIGGLRAGGSTNIHDALLTALGQLAERGERPALVVLLTDGLPTVGVVDPPAIVSAVEAAATAGVRLFNFGLGYDVNTLLLDELAERNHGLSEYVRPDEDVSDAVTRFYERVSDPVLGNVSLDFGGVEVYDLYPHPLPDLFAGSQLVVAGRYRGSGTTDITLGGSLGGETRELVFEAQELPQQATRNGYVPRLWATRKIGFLLNSVRFNGPTDEVVEEIVLLSKRFGVITPYTSFLVEEPRMSLGDAQKSFRLQVAPTLAPAMGAPTSGSQAFETAKEVAGYARADSVASGSGGATAERVRNVREKTFLLDGGVWTDTAYSGGPTVKVGFGSEDYFRLLERRPDWGAYFALGQRVVFVSEGTAYEVASGDFPTLEAPPPAVGPSGGESERQGQGAGGFPRLFNDYLENAIADGRVERQQGAGGFPRLLTAVVGGAVGLVLVVGVLAPRLRKGRAPGQTTDEAQD